MVTYTYYKRAKCICGYLWTTGAFQSVVCRCASGMIIGDEIINLEEVDNEEEFLEAVRQDIAKPTEEILLINGST